MSTKTISIPIRLISESNNRDHWSKKNARKRQIQMIVRSHWYFGKEFCNVKVPVELSFVRKGPRLLDSDNLITSFKSIRDQVCDLITPGLAPGRSDDLPGLSFKYSQEKSKEYSIEIHVTEIND